MVSVIIPTLNAEATLVPTLAALVPAVVDGIVREVIVADGRSEDATCAAADGAGARIVTCDPGRGIQLKAGADVALHDWLLFLHADTVLEHGWHEEVRRLIEKVETGGAPQTAAVFRFALDDDGAIPRVVEWGVNLRCYLFSMPYGDQGLLIPRSLYNEIGGFKPVRIFEDVDIVRRLGRHRLAMLRSRATTSAVRFREAGYISRVLRNWRCLMLYYLGASPERLEKVYHG